MEEREIIIHPCKQRKNLPALSDIMQIPREKILRLVFPREEKQFRTEYGDFLKKQLPGFLIRVDIQNPEIDICKLITFGEVEDNQVFFENCAKDYRQLSTDLVHKLVAHLDLDLMYEAPMETFNPLKKSPQKSSGDFGDWSYYIHGFHVGCRNNKSGQCIEIPLMFNSEFGALDPYFFCRFIKSMPREQPLPVNIYEDYHDGNAIIGHMVTLNRFEVIPSNWKGLHQAVAVDRDPITRVSFSRPIALNQRTSWLTKLFKR